VSECARARVLYAPPLQESENCIAIQRQQIERLIVEPKVQDLLRSLKVRDVGSDEEARQYAIDRMKVRARARCR